MIQISDSAANWIDERTGETGTKKIAKMVDSSRPHFFFFDDSVAGNGCLAVRSALDPLNEKAD